MEEKIFYIDNIGCHIRSYDAEKIKNHLVNNHYIFTDIYEDAEIVIIIGCLADTIQLGRTNQIISDHYKNNKKVILSGCISKENIEKYEHAGIYVPPDGLDKIDNIIDDLSVPFIHTAENFKIFPSENSRIYLSKLKKYRLNFSFPGKIYKDILSGLLFEKRKPDDFHFIQINTGCSFDCSFCNTRFCFNDVTSKPLSKVISEYKALMQKKIRDVVFISEDIGSYGKDINTNLFDMLLSLYKIDNNNYIKWHLDAINPYWSILFEDKVLAMVRTNKIKSIVFTIQSGSSRILKLMNRYDNVKEIKNNIRKIKKGNAGLRTYGFFMVGFPSETEQEYKSTLELIKELNFDDVFISCYSEFDHCESARIFPKIPDEEIIRRYDHAKKYLEKYNIFCRN